jgi:hypothetical protein
MSTMAQPTATIGYLPIRYDWLARRTEAIVEPDLPIVDPHYHFWDRLEGPAQDWGCARANRVNFGSVS